MPRAWGEMTSPLRPYTNLEEADMTSAIMAFLHHLMAFTLTGAIIYEHITFRKDLSLAEARRIQIMDIVYGTSAGLLVIVGLLRVFYFEKGAAVYAQNWFFWIKMAGFALAALLSIFPTIRFISWRKFTTRNQVPEISDRELKRIKMILRLETLAIAIIIFSAAMMARGIGMM
jgi:putative membrane protein